MSRADDSSRKQGRKEETESLKRVVIERLGPEGHSTLETSIDDALVVLADEIARGFMIFSRNNQQRIENEEELRGLEDSADDPIRIMVIPPVAGG